MSNNLLVLVVDDDPDMVDSVSMKLESNQYRVIKAYDGVEAWEKIREDKPNLIVLDVMMPRKNGYELCKEIKTDPKYKDIVVILFTAVANDLSRTNYWELEGKNSLADDYVGKPVDLDKLMAIIKTKLP